MAIQAPFPLQAWIDDHRHLLKPPVGNAKVYEDTEFIVMVVGGPNARKDYHYNEGEELPPRTPHSPRRPADTVGLVIERKRTTQELDAFMWFCESCGTKLYEEFLPLTDIVSQLPPIFERFWSNLEHRTCKSCGTVLEPPEQK